MSWHLHDPAARRSLHIRTLPCRTHAVRVRPHTHARRDHAWSAPSWPTHSHTHTQSRCAMCAGCHGNRERIRGALLSVGRGAAGLGGRHRCVALAPLSSYLVGITNPTQLALHAPLHGRDADDEQGRGLVSGSGAHVPRADLPRPTPHSRLLKLLPAWSARSAADGVEALLAAGRLRAMTAEEGEKLAALRGVGTKRRRGVHNEVYGTTCHFCRWGWRGSQGESNFRRDAPMCTRFCCSERPHARAHVPLLQAGRTRARAPT
jgi:hypothetical protein